jgi:hypothetical protein
MVAAERDLVGQELILARLSMITEQYNSITSRRKGGLIDFVGDMVKSLFGFGTDKDVQELKGIVSQNRNSLKTIVHNTKHLLSVVNVTRYEMIENRKAINQLIDATKLLKEWVENTKFRVDRSFKHVQIYQGLMFKIDMLQQHVNHIRRVKDKVLRMRNDLERGFLSEDLLPLESLESLINSPLIPTGTEFIQPLNWYYSGLKVKLVNIMNELVYSVNLPLVSTDQAFATTFISYPTPNVNEIVTIKVDVQGSSLFNSLTGQVVDIADQCYGTDPLVCPPMPVRRDNLQVFTCKEIGRAHV